MHFTFQSSHMGKFLLEEFAVQMFLRHDLGADPTCIGICPAWVCKSSDARKLGHPGAGTERQWLSGPRLGIGGRTSGPGGRDQGPSLLGPDERPGRSLVSVPTGSSLPQRPLGDGSVPWETWRPLDQSAWRLSLRGVPVVPREARTPFSYFRRTRPLWRVL